VRMCVCRCMEVGRTENGKDMRMSLGCGDSSMVALYLQAG
jgi:hypothetical protein